MSWHNYYPWPCSMLTVIMVVNFVHTSSCKKGTNKQYLCDAKLNSLVLNSLTGTQVVNYGGGRDIYVWLIACSKDIIIRTSRLPTLKKMISCCRQKKRSSQKVCDTKARQVVTCLLREQGTLSRLVASTRVKLKRHWYNLVAQSSMYPYEVSTPVGSVQDPKGKYRSPSGQNDQSKGTLKSGSKIGKSAPLKKSKSSATKIGSVSSRNPETE